ncbi:MAG: thiamine diphosphokinase [Oscillospiraceae bacterium]|nr:thiamine diphosphokinase [Oscillospiraceae bacterium]
MKPCVIVGAGEFTGLSGIRHTDYYYIIAADGGYDNLKQFGIKPDLIIGDLDSINNIPADIETIRFPIEKSASDMELAVEEAIRRGYGYFYIYGALGKRLDHTLANIAVLVNISKRGYLAYLIGGGCEITAVTNSRLTFGKEKTGVVSVFPAGDEARGVTLTGLKYPLCDAVIKCGTTVGLSNEFLGVESFIKVKNGTLVVIITDR